MVTYCDENIVMNLLPMNINSYIKVLCAHQSNALHNLLHYLFVYVMYK